MNDLDIKFLDEYKRLDSLCSDLLSCQHGVSEYIEQMRTSSDKQCYKIASWDNDYSMLLHLRWVRNQIVHNSNACGICNNYDIESVVDFYNRIMNQQDPFSALYKLNLQADSKHSKVPYPVEQKCSEIKQNSKQTDRNINPKFNWLKFFMILAVVFVIVLAFCFLFSDDDCLNKIKN